jgi:hypothetical protein
MFNIDEKISVDENDDFSISSKDDSDFNDDDDKLNEIDK